MFRAQRRKRASDVDLYRSCKLGGDCIPDVQNKIEGKTLADRLLQIFGSFLYFGNLGIGTGKGSGGFGGYGPIGGTTRTAPEFTITRPTVPLDPLGGADVIPLDIINPEAPAVIPLQEGGIPNITITDTSNSNIDIAEIDVTTSLGPTETIHTTNTQPTVITDTSNAVVIDMQPGPPPPKRIALDLDSSTDRDIQMHVFQIPTLDANVNIFVDPNVTGDIVGFEEIELGPLNRPDEFAIEEGPGPTSSTPTQRLERVINQGQQLYSRFVQQVQTRNPDFIRQPSRLVRFEFENPAFDDDVTLAFEQDVNEVAAAPEYEFRDIVKLGRPLFSETTEGLRISRLGQRSSITTRSGLKIGQKVHFYYDISKIEEEPEIEMATFGIHSGESTTINDYADSTVVDSNFGGRSYPDHMLEDVYEENFRNAHLVLTNSISDREVITIPSLSPGFNVKVFVGDVANTLTVDFPSYSPEDTIITPRIPITPLGPALTVNYSLDDFYLHPELLKKRRKRKYVNI